MQRALLVSLLVLASACDSPAPSLLESSGPYRGVLSLAQGTKVREWLVAATAALLSDANQVSVLITPAGSEPAFTLAAKFDSKSLILASPGVLSQEVRLSAGIDGCFQAASPSRDRVCFDGQEFLISLAGTARGDLSLLLQKFDPATGLGLESPDSFTTDQLRERGIARNFDTRIEYEHVIQAKLSAQVARMNLLPHFSFNSFFALVTMETTQLIRQVGDLAPFLLPTRWVKARQAGLQASAEAFAFRAMRADTGNIAEGLAYTVLRDERAIGILRAQRDRIEQLQKLVKGQERIGIASRGASDDLTSLLNATDLSITLQKQALEEEYTALALATGFVNPHAISAVLPGAFPDIDSPDPIDEDQLAQISVLRSLELRQLDSLIAQARSSRNQRLFGWTDPAGDSSGALGFGIVDYVRIGNSQVSELAIRRDKLKAIHLQKVANALSELRGSTAAYATAKSDIMLQESRVSRVLGNVRLGIPVTIPDLISALQGRMKTELDVNTAEFTYYNAVSKVMRLSLSGPYQDIDRP